MIALAAFGFLVLPFKWVAVLIYLIALNRYLISGDERARRQFNAWRTANMRDFDALPPNEQERRWQKILA